MPNKINACKLLVTLLALLKAQDEMLATLLLDMQMLYLMMQQLSMLAGAMSSMPGQRRKFGTKHIYNLGQVETVEEMMEENPDQFYELFRMQPSTFEWLLEALWQHVHGPEEDGDERQGRKKRGRRPCRILFRNRLLYTIFFLASGCSYRQLSFVWGKTLDWRDLLISELASMKDSYVCWPHPQSTLMLDVCKGFERLRGFKGCCGCIDGSYIKIRAPLLQDLNPGDYNTYKKFYAIQILAVCTANKLFTYVHAGTPGSRGDAWILKQTTLWNHTQQYLPKGDSFNNYSPHFYLLGDSGFQLLPWLMIPFSRKQERETPVEGGLRKRRQMYSADQKSTRACVENSFGILKARWHCLRDGLQCMLQHATPTVWACIVLHNICIAQHDIWAYYDSERDKDDDAGMEKPPPTWLVADTSIPPPPPNSKKTDAKAAQAVRNHLVEDIARDNHRHRA